MRDEEQYRESVPSSITENEPSAGSEITVQEEVGEWGGWLDADDLREGVTECLENIDKAEESLLQLEENPDDAEAINRVFRAFHNVKGFAGLVNAKPLQHVAHLSENLLDRARDGEIRVEGMIADMVLEALDSLKSMLKALGSNTKWTESEKDASVRRFLEFSAENPSLVVTVDSNENGRGESAVEETTPQRSQEKASDSSSQASTGEEQKRNGEGEQSLRVSTQRLDWLIDMVGELVIAQAMVVEHPDLKAKDSDSSLIKNVVNMGKIIRDLQDVSMSLRMVPLAATFRRMARLARDTARKAGKEIHFVTDGEDTEIDRSMVEIITDPLIHMMRNSVDHGIELPDVRAKEGKDRVGNIKLTANHESGYVVINLHDDGKGIDTEKVRQKAIAKGLIAESQELTHQEILNLVFLPGFSTAEKVTDLSGRGVGMDVVRTNIEKINGQISIDSEKGKGTSVSLRLPLTLAIIEGMLVQVGEHNFTLPLLNIRESVVVSTEQIITTAVTGEEYVKIRDKIFPVVRLNSLYNIKQKSKRLEEGILIVLENQGNDFCVFVDELIGQRQTVVKSLPGFLGKVRGISSCSILASGEISLILDVAGVFSLAQNGSQMFSSKDRVQKM